MSTLYLSLLHGRNDINEDLNDWGFAGPVLEIGAYHTTYGNPRVEDKLDGEWYDLHVEEGLLYYDGKWYGDWTVSSDMPVVTIASPPGYGYQMLNSDLLTPPEPVAPLVDPAAPSLDVASEGQDEADMPASNEALERMVNDLTDVIEAVCMRSTRFGSTADGEPRYVFGDDDRKLLHWWLMKGRLLTDNAPEWYVLPATHQEMP